MMTGNFNGERLSIWFKYTYRWNRDEKGRFLREGEETPEWQALKEEGLPLDLRLGSVVTTCNVELGPSPDKMRLIAVADAMYSKTEKKPFCKETGRAIALQRISEILLNRAKEGEPLALPLRRAVAEVYRNRKMNQPKPNLTGRVTPQTVLLRG
jgi:hypothetical protein